MYRPLCTPLYSSFILSSWTTHISHTAHIQPTDRLYSSHKVDILLAHLTHETRTAYTRLRRNIYKTEKKFTTRTDHTRIRLLTQLTQKLTRSPCAHHAVHSQLTLSSHKAHTQLTPRSHSAHRHVQAIRPLFTSLMYRNWPV